MAREYIDPQSEMGPQRGYDAPSSAYKRSFGLGKGLGKGRFLRERGFERASELERYERELAAAEEAQEADWEEQDLWSIVTGSIGAVGAGGATFLATKDPYLSLKAGAKGWTVGSEVGKWGQHFTSDYDPEDYALSTDVGRHDVSERWKLEDVNQQFARAEEAKFYEDIAETGKNLGSLWMLFSGGSNIAGEEAGAWLG